MVVHGAVFNGIMTGELWTRAPNVGRPLHYLNSRNRDRRGRRFPIASARALLVAGALFAAYAVTNGSVLFDYGNRIVGPRARSWPSASFGRGRPLHASWSGHRAQRITRRFSTYADSKLVDYVLETGLESSRVKIGK